jgi:hypothetical protein
MTAAWTTTWLEDMATRLKGPSPESRTATGENTYPPKKNVGDKKSMSLDQIWKSATL